MLPHHAVKLGSSVRSVGPGLPRTTRCLTHKDCKAQGPYGVASALEKVLSGSLSVYAVSDLHTDYKENLSWVQNLQPCHSCKDTSHTSVLIIAGDISDDIRLLRTTLEAFVSKFTAVAFVPGNHELWIKGSQERNAGATDSIDKLCKLSDLCKELGVVTQPAQFGGVCIVPLLSWHHQSFDKEADIAGIPRAGAMTISDYGACKWPVDFPGAHELGSEATAAWFDAANDEMQQPSWLQQQVLQQRTHAGLPDVVSFSHFLPHQSLLPEKRMLAFPNLAKAVGSDFLWQRLQQLQPNMHVFGHSHFAWDMDVEGIRCVQAPLCYPAERQLRPKSVIFHDSGSSSHWQHRQRNAHKSNGGSATRQGSISAITSRIKGVSGTGQDRPDAMLGAAKDLQLNSLGWLPVKVYEASYAAALQQLPHAITGSLTGSDSSCLQAGNGLPVLHGSQLAVLQQQQLSCNGQQKQDNCSDSGLTADGSQGGLGYVLTKWQGNWCPNLGGMWSEYYKANAREPNNTQLAPWVLKRYQKFRQWSAQLESGSVSE